MCTGFFFAGNTDKTSPPKGVREKLLQINVRAEGLHADQISVVVNQVV